MTPEHELSALRKMGPLATLRSVRPTVQPYKHAVLIDACIVALVENRLSVHGISTVELPVGDRVDNLLVTLPPRHGKSMLVSESAPAWFLDSYPDCRVLLTSYEADFSADWGRKARDLGIQIGLPIDKTSKSRDHWNLLSPNLGGMSTAGAGGALTGKGGHLLIVDDPIKNQEEANNPLLRDKLWEWFQSTWSTRREPGGKMLMCVTRWNDDDVAGRVLRAQPGEWYHLNLPAIQPGEPGDKPPTRGLESGALNPLGRRPGQALCPERFNEDALAGIRNLMGEYYFSALYQQTPKIEEGGLFARSDFVNPVNQFGTIIPVNGPPTSYDKCFFFQVIDLAASKKTWADYTVIQTWASLPQGYLVLIAQYRAKLDSADHQEQVEAHYRETIQSGIPVKFIGVEKATYGLTLIEQLQRKGIPLVELKPDTDKHSRAIPASGMVRLGRMQICDFPGREDLIDEAVVFPNGGHDDMVDCLAYAAQLLHDGRLPIRSGVEKPQPLTGIEGRFALRRSKKVKPKQVW